MFHSGDTIVAPATASGGALAVIRVSGCDAISICDSCFRSPSGKTLANQDGYTALYGNIVSVDGAFIDEVIATIFRAPASYTGEDSVEISCHGSCWIVSEIIRTITNNGARVAEAGEFTVRAFLAGKLDLAQAEAVADMIASDNRASHSIASTQLRGKYSEELSSIRAELLRLASLLELELDFSEEDVTFADRRQLTEIIDRATAEINRLSESFVLGNAIKEGIGVAIVGDPNVGKSTLLNRLIGDDRAMVSDIAGTTRDVIEERINIDGIGFRFIDTAGIRHSDDVLEQMGIKRTYKAAAGAKIILYMVDGIKAISGVYSTDSTTHNDGQDGNYISLSSLNAASIISDSINRLGITENQKLAVIINKCDTPETEEELNTYLSSLPFPIIPISAKSGRNIDALKSFLTSTVDTAAIFGGQAIVSNTRHHEALRKASKSLYATHDGISNNIPSDLLANDLRHALNHIGEITGEITTNEILSEIFSKFCIGK